MTFDFDEFIKTNEALCEAATPGPWDNRCKEFSNTERARHIWTEYGWICTFNSPLESSEADAALTAQSRTSLPLALKLLKKWKEALVVTCYCDDPYYRSVGPCMNCEALAYDPTKEEI